MTTQATTFCFAAAPYANSAPLAHYLTTVSPQTRLSEDFPARLTQRLQDGSADVALLPVAELLAHPELTLIEGLGVCARTQVRSVLLKCRRPLAEVRVVELDTASRTSNALTQVLLREHWKLSVKTVFPAEHASADAAVVIGDRALCAAPAPHGDYDLAEHWNRLTGLPFVFAVWALRRQHPAAPELGRIAHAAHRAGMAALPELARLQAAKLGLPEPECLAYLSHCIHYDLGAPERQAMQLFGQLIAKLGAAK